MTQLKYNGYSNHDTWLVILWTVKNNRNYNIVKRDKAFLLKLKKEVFLKTLKSITTIPDGVNWNNVRITDLKQVIREM